MCVKDPNKQRGVLAQAKQQQREISDSTEESDWVCKHFWHLAGVRALPDVRSRSLR
jgi:hypothetical protein